MRFFVLLQPNAVYIQYMKLLLIITALTIILPSMTFAQNIDFEHDGLTRQYRIHIPNELPESPALVIAMHGYSGNNNEMMNDYGWTELADERGFIIAFPNGTRDQSNNRFWDVDYSFHAGLDIDDDGFITSSFNKKSFPLCKFV